jgi:hypothetical protein
MYKWSRYNGKRWCDQATIEGEEEKRESGVLKRVLSHNTRGETISIGKRRKRERPKKPKGTMGHRPHIRSPIPFMYTSTFDIAITTVVL